MALWASGRLYIPRESLNLPPRCREGKFQWSALRRRVPRSKGLGLGRWDLGFGGQGLWGSFSGFRESFKAVRLAGLSKDLGFGV